MTAAGCVVCPYPVYADEGERQIDPLAVRQTPPFEQFWITCLFWQPVPAGQP
jgi:hypothetical protein